MPVNNAYELTENETNGQDDKNNTSASDKIYSYDEALELSGKWRFFVNLGLAGVLFWFVYLPVWFFYLVNRGFLI